MRYTLFLYANEQAFEDISEEQSQVVQQAYQAYGEQLRDAGVLIDADWLQATTSATTVCLQDGELRVQDGPFADSKEQLGGVYVIDVPDLDTAMRWAAKCPGAEFGHIEIRPTRFG